MGVRGPVKRVINVPAPAPWAIPAQPVEPVEPVEPATVPTSPPATPQPVEAPAGV